MAPERVEVTHPEASVEFGDSILVLSNGNLVVVDPGWENATTEREGAVHLFDGRTNEHISMLRGMGDVISVVEVGASDFVVTGVWLPANGDERGSITWVDGEAGLDAVVSSANSVMGDKAGDAIGSGGVYALTDGNYVAVSPNYADGSIERAGAVTWFDGSGPVTGVLDGSRSIVGDVEDQLGLRGVTPLPGGSYVIDSPEWQSADLRFRGAITWVPGGAPIVEQIAEVTTDNSLVGDGLSDPTRPPVVVLSNGNYVVGTPGWGTPGAARRGAVTWADGSTGLVATIGPGVSLVGETALDEIGSSGVTALSDGNYIVNSPAFDGPARDSGAATWMDGSSTATGTVSVTNSVAGDKEMDFVGAASHALADGRFVVASPGWDDGEVVDVGAVTWVGSSAAERVAVVSRENSIVGARRGDAVGSDVAVLTDGDYVAVSPDVNLETASTVGAFTWAPGDRSSSFVISPDNSIVGVRQGDGLSLLAVPLVGGDYVAAFPNAQGISGPIGDVGAVRRASGDGSSTGAIDDSNSLVGFGVGAQVVAFDIGGYAVVAPGFADGLGGVVYAPGETALVGEVGSVGATAAEPELILLTPALTSGGYMPGFTRGSVVALYAIATPPPPPPPAPPGPIALDPVRLMDTRLGGTTVDGRYSGRGPLNQQELISVELIGRGELPGRAEDLDAAILNITAVNPTARGFFTVYPCGEQPGSSSLNFSAAGGVIANEIIAPISEFGEVCINTTVGTGLVNDDGVHLLIDLVGYVPANAPYGALEPGRLLDTRPGGSTIDRRYAGVGIIDSGRTRELQVSGRGGVPANDVVGAVVNVAAVNPTERGFLTIFPCGTRPLASSLNYDAAGGVIANEIVAGLDGRGKICIFAQSTTHVIVDVVGYVPFGAQLVSLVPERALDTREPEPTGGTRVEPGSVTEIQITGFGEIPPDASAVVANVTAVSPLGRGYLTIFPCGDRPTASSLNFSAAGAVVANEVVAKLDDRGRLCIYSSTSTHLVLDTVGYLQSQS